MSGKANTKICRGRLAASPTGLLHLGHARTFWMAGRRAAQHGAQLILRNEDLDSQRCRPEFVQAMLDDLRWLGIEWAEGPDCGGPCGPYTQSERRGFYLEAWRRLRDSEMIYPCTCSRKDVAQAARGRRMIWMMSRFTQGRAGHPVSSPTPLGFIFARQPPRLLPDGQK
jgi:glutamyl/glutaminyl-tRNA synthetase